MDTSQGKPSQIFTLKNGGLDKKHYMALFIIDKREKR